MAQDQLCGAAEKVGAPLQSSNRVDRTGTAQEHGDKTERDQSKGRQHALPSNETISSLLTRKNQVTRPVVVLAIQPCNGHEVRELPKEEHGGEHPRLQAQPPRCRSPSDQWGHGSGKGADQRTERSSSFERRVQK